MTYDNIKRHKKKQGFTLTLEDTFLKNHMGGVKLTPHSPLCYLRVKRIFKLHGVLRLESDSYIFCFLKPDAFVTYFRIFFP